MRTQHIMSRRTALAAALGLGAVGRHAGAQIPNTTSKAASEDPWPSLAAQIFDKQTINDGSTILAIDAPYRAEDAAVVPLTIQNRLPAGAPRQIHDITVVIDQNPSPVAAKFTFGANSGIRSLSTRIRVDSYTNIHAVAALGDGTLYVAKRFVKAAGGCSAPAAKQEADAIPLGTMRFRQFPPRASEDTPEVQLMIRHPNYSGMQMDQITRLYVPAHFVSSLRIWQGDDLLLGVESGISISENPEYRFDYRPNGATQFRAEVQDNKGNTFNKTWPSARA